MGEREIREKTAELEERVLRPIGEMWALLHKKLDACPEREDDAPHEPQFGEMTSDISCAHCGAPLVLA